MFYQKNVFSLKSYNDIIITPAIGIVKGISEKRNINKVYVMIFL